MLLIIGTATTFLIFLAACLFILPLTLSLFIVVTAGSFIAFQVLQNPANVSRVWTHVKQAASPELWLRTQEISVSGASSSNTRARDSDRTSVRNRLANSNSVPCEDTASNSLRTRGKENVAEYLRPILKPRRFVNSRPSPHGPSPWNEFRGQNLTSTSDFQSQRQSPAPATARPRATGDANASFVPIINLDEKQSFSRLPLSPIFPPNKSLNSPDQELNSSMLRFNSGQDSMLHPSMHYPTHQPELITSPGLVPSVSWLKEGALSSPRHRKGLPRIQSPVMVKIASPLPDRPASPLFRKLASEEKTRKSSSTDKVIMAIKQRQKRTVQETGSDVAFDFTPPVTGKESKRRKLDSACGNTTPEPTGVDMDLGHIPVNRGMRNVFAMSSKHGITSPTPRNPIVSSVSSSKRAQGALKRRKDTSSVEVEEEDGVSPIKKSVPPTHPQPTPHAKSPGRKAISQQPIAKVTADTTSTFSPLRSGGKPLYFEKNADGGRDGRDTQVTPSKSGLKKAMFTPQRTPRAQRVDTPGEYTAADKAEDRAQARKRVSYLKEMLMDEPEPRSSQGGTAPGATVKPQPSLFTTTTTQATTSASLPSISAPPLKNLPSASSGIAAATPAATTATAGAPLGSGLFAGLKKSAATSASVASSATTPATMTAAGGGTGLKLPPTPATVASQTSVAPSGLLNALGSSHPTLGAAKPLGGNVGTGFGATHLDATAKSSAASSTGPTMQSSTLSTSVSGGFSLAGQAPAFGTPSKAATLSSSTAATSGTTSQPQFKPAFGAAVGTAASSLTPSQPTSIPSVQAQSGGFQFGQSAGTAASAGSFAFGKTPAQTTASALGNVAAPFPSTAASTQAKSTFSMPPTTTTSAATGRDTTFTPVFGEPPKTSQPSTTTTADPKFPSVFGQTPKTSSTATKADAKFPSVFGQPPNTSQPSSSSGQVPSFKPAFGAPSQTANQSATGGFSFGATTTTTTAAATSTTPATFNFGSAGGAAPKAATSITGAFGSTGQSVPAFGASNGATTAKASVFGTPSAPGSSLQPQASAGAGSTTKPGSVFGSGTTQQAFGATPSAAASVFGSSSTPGTAPSAMFGGATAAKPAFGGTPSATVNPFGGSGASQTSQTPSGFQFGGTQPQGSTQSSQPSGSGAFNFGAQKPASSFNKGSTSTPGPTFQFGQATPTQPAAGASQSAGFFSATPAASPAQFNAAPSFGGSPAPSFGAAPSPAPSFAAAPSPAPSFAAAPSPAAGAPPGGGFSIGTGGNNNSATNQRRANRLRQVRSRAGRR